MMSSGGKGSKPRPYSIPFDRFSSNWDNIFSNKNEKDTTKTNQTDKSSQPGDLVVPRLQQNTNG